MRADALIYKNALQAIRAYCERAWVGGWRHDIVAIIDRAIKEGEKHD